MKTILFTGARSGIASCVIEKLLQKDYFIYVTVHTEKERRAVEKKYTNNKNVACFCLDVTSSFDRAKLENLDIDIFVSNAAVGYGGSILEIPVEWIRKNYEVNVFSNLECLQIVLKKMIVKKKGKIILMSSLAGVLPIPFLGSYCSTKASLIMLAKVLKKELQFIDADISIKVIEPGIYCTGFNEAMRSYQDISSSIYFRKRKEDIAFFQHVLFDLLGKKNLDSIGKKIVCAIESDSQRFLYSAPFSQKTFAKLYQIFKG